MNTAVTAAMNMSAATITMGRNSRLKIFLASKSEVTETNSSVDITSIFSIKKQAKKITK